MDDPAHRASNAELRRIEKRLRQIYSRAEKELQEKADEYFSRFASLDAKKKALVEAGKITESEYRNWRRAQLMIGQHWREMQEAVAVELYRTNETALRYINGRLPNVYAANYNFSAREIQRLCDNAVSFQMINRRAVESLVKAGNNSLLPLKKLDPAKDIPWNMRKVNSAVMQGIIQGESIPQIASRVTNVTAANEVSSVRAARTIVNGVENKARHDAAEKAQEKGVVMGKVWLYTHDNRTRDAHVQAGLDYGTNANAIPLDDPFIVGGEEMEYPGDTDASAWNVYNCRCTHRNVVRGFTSVLPPEKRGHIKVRFD